MGVKNKIKGTRGIKSNSIDYAFSEFMCEKMAEGKAKSTLRAYEQSWQYFMDFCAKAADLDGDDDVNSINSLLLNTWIIAITKDTVNGKKSTTVNHYLRDVRVFLYWCMDKGYIEDDFKIKLVKAQEEEIKLYSEEDLEKLLEKPHRKEPFTVWRSWAVVNFVLGTGVRASTVCNVKLRDLDFKRKEVRLAHTKNKKAQINPLSAGTIVALKEYITMFNIGERDGDDAWLFPSIEAEQLTTGALSHSYYRYCKDRGVERTNIHGLRHNFAKAYVINGGNMMKLQRILGHSTLAMTQKYVKLFVDDLKEDYNEVVALDNIKKPTSRKRVIQRRV